MLYAVIAITIALILSLLSLRLTSFVMTGSRQTLDEAMQWQSERYDTSFYNDLEHTDYTVESFDGYVLHARLLRCPAHSGKYVIISHGYTDNRIGSLKYAKMYISLGYSCIIYDLRGHGMNQPTFTTYGIREGQDITELVRDTRARYKDIVQLGLHGESLGAASTVTALKYKPEVDFVVADCGFSDIHISRKLIENSTRDLDVQTLIKTIVAIGNEMAISVSAVGVETETQADLLRSLGIRRMHGFYFGKPVDKETFMKKYLID